MRPVAHPDRPSGVTQRPTDSFRTCGCPLGTPRPGDGGPRARAFLRRRILKALLWKIRAGRETNALEIWLPRPEFQ